MHTLAQIVAGLALLAVFWFIAHSKGHAFGPWLNRFLATWFTCSAINMAIGMISAGYSFMEELPYFLIVSGVPGFVAWVMARSGA